MRLTARILVALNRVFPRPIDYGGDTPEAYSRWEYESGGAMFERHFEGRFPVEGSRLLDLGCGTGGKAAFYAERGPERLVAVDVLSENLEHARRFARSRGVEERIEFTLADAARLPFSDGSFDGVTATDTFEHFADPPAVLAEIERVLRPGGRVLFYFTPHRSPLGSHLYDVVHLPWCHLVFREETLFEAIRMIYEREEGEGGGSGNAQEARRRARAKLEYFRADLNGMTVGRFLSMVRANRGFDLPFFIRRPLKTRLLAPLTRLPGLDELFTTLAIGLLQKRPPR
jgi:SAM-dependent methyltransferase